MLRFNGHLKLPAQVSLIGFVKCALSDVCLSWTGPRFTASSSECPYPRLSSLVVPWHFLGPSLSSYFYNRSAVCVRGFQFLWLSLLMQWQQGMQQQENHTAGTGKTKHKTKANSDCAQISSSLHLLIRFSELRWEMGQSFERRDAKYGLDDCLSHRTD